MKSLVVKNSFSKNEIFVWVWVGVFKPFKDATASNHFTLIDHKYDIRFATKKNLVHIVVVAQNVSP